MKTVLKLVIAVAFLNAMIRGADSMWSYYKLKDEAQALLNEYQRKQKDALKEAAEIVETAKTVAQRQARDAAAALDAAFTRREKLAIEKIAQAEAAALAEVRREAVDVASSEIHLTVAAQVAVTQIVRQDENDIWRRRN